MEIREFLYKILLDKESNEVEFKSARGGFPGSFWETYSSFANTDGGAVIFGAKGRDCELKNRMYSKRAFL